MLKKLIKEVLSTQYPAERILIHGWVRTRRDAKGFSFLEVNDGSCLKNLQVVVEHGVCPQDALAQFHTGAAVAIEGRLEESPGKGQQWELRATTVSLIGPADPETYPLQKKRHSDEFLRTIAHLRPRTNKYGAMFRIRSESAFAVHQFFRDRGFYHLHSPIITGSDCEGAGALFRVTTLPIGQAIDQPAEGSLSQADFFGQEASLTVSGQLEAELFACSLGRVYTFGPTFRAENSNTPRHAAEFWMIEPEMAFADIFDNMDLAEELVKVVGRQVIEQCGPDLELFAKFVDPELMKILDNVLASEFVRLPYAEALILMEKSGKKFEFPPTWGTDLQTEHERFLCEDYFQKPVIVYNYPKEIKPFYMRANDDGRTVAAMDLLVPRVGELVGGSQREERLEVLEKRMTELGFNLENYWWYRDIRRFGTTPHAGFGMGFERFLMLMTGATNIRDVIPFPRTPKHLDF